MEIEEVKTSDRSQHWLDEIERYEKASRTLARRRQARSSTATAWNGRACQVPGNRSSSRPTFNISLVEHPDHETGFVRPDTGDNCRAPPP